MPAQTNTVRSRRRERPLDHSPRRDADNLPQRIGRVRDEVFGLVSELQRTQAAMPQRELESAADQMQSIANQLGAIEAAFAASGR
jgi:hypothetical protein